jgi:hypothetical protein
MRAQWGLASDPGNQPELSQENNDTAAFVGADSLIARRDSNQKM